MTLLIIIMSVTNIALGYGLAIYFGHAQAPWALGKQTTNYRPPEFREKSRDSGDDDTETIEQAAAETAVGDASDETPGESAEQETAASETVTEEKLSEGIDAFQEQLKE